MILLPWHTWAGKYTRYCIVANELNVFACSPLHNTAIRQQIDAQLNSKQ